MIDRQIKERRRLTNELAVIKQRLLTTRIEVGQLLTELEINTEEKVVTMNTLSRAYDMIDNAKQLVIDITKDRL